MKNLFLTTPKKVLLATSILAMSTTAIAESSTELDGSKDAGLTVAAHYVTPLTVGLDLAAIDFGDVFTDSVVADQAVKATVAGTQGETFTYSVVSSKPLLVTVDTLAATLTGVAFTTGSTTLDFNIGLDASKIVDGADVAETITVTVTYDSIDSTTNTTAA
ncbi:hypothetical protein Ping_3059 [Psychromonas ingrahamii 37]|uniref:Uncharacterized protein n=1 Tax=Psychromonas ingrahamii (strain DSM 17664 / CCUG 51855 / 37) TaxID=357804 RepID=A1SZ44_PSYIN|nr:hypothetical protein [Psychromonas ingrahamii]ABM04759.1 hypothetical protein Ping_3059 [Psychromonas ingrahamii 37]